MAKKHPFFCEKCNTACSIYKRGKAHRVFVCPNCGVLATNGKGVGKSILKRGARAILGEVPGASSIMEGIGLVGDIKRSKKSEVSHVQHIESGKPGRSERIINKELYGE